MVCSQLARASLTPIATTLTRRCAVCRERIGEPSTGWVHYLQYDTSGQAVPSIRTRVDLTTTQSLSFPPLLQVVSTLSEAEASLLSERIEERSTRDDWTRVPRVGIPVPSVREMEVVVGLHHISMMSLSQGDSGLGESLVHAFSILEEEGVKGPCGSRPHDLHELTDWYQYRWWLGRR